MIDTEHLFDYEGPVQNIAPHFVFNAERTAIAIPCRDCFQREISFALEGVFEPFGRFVMMRRKSCYFQLPLVSAYYMTEIAILEVRLWMGQCQICGVIYQSWEVKPE